MSSEAQPIRDFLYLDVDRLYSMYSQVFEGVVAQIVHSYEGSLVQNDQQEGGFASGSTTEATVAEMSRRTENRFLYDDMYGRLEEKILNMLLDGALINAENAREEVASAPLIKVSGPAEIEDYNRMRTFMDRFNELGEAIAYASLINSDLKKQAMEALSKAESIRDKSQKNSAKAQIKEAVDPKKVAEKLGLQQDPQYLNNLAMFTDLFYPDGFDITISSPTNGQAIAFKAPLDRQWLRVSPDMLRKLYGNYAESHWTVVGQVTYVPGDEPPTAIIDATPDAAGNSQPSLRDAFSTMFRASRAFDRVFLESKKRIEIVICPLTIYRVVSTRPGRSDS